MRVIDASSVLHAWDNYPIGNFPRLWLWLASQISDGEILIPRVALEEVGHISHDCKQWLDGVEGFASVEVSNAIAAHAIAINAALGIRNDQYGTGVDSNDVLIIATAKANGAPLITNESRQPDLPINLKKYKIPAVCALPSVAVTSLNFAELIRASNREF